MNFVDLKLFKPEERWWEHESIDSSIFTKMDLSFNYIYIAQLVKASEQNSVFMGSNPTQGNFL